MSNIVTLPPEGYLEQANMLCQAEWIISPFIHNLVLLVAQEYQKRGITPEKFDYVTVPVRSLFAYSVKDPGETYYLTVHDLFGKIADARVILQHANGDMEQVQIFRGRTYYSKKREELTVCFNQDLYDFWIDLHALYTKLPLMDMLSLPNIKYIRLMFQVVASFKFLGQKEMDYEALKRIMHCEKMLPGIFKRDVLIPCHKTINEKTSLKFDFELLHGKFNRIEKIQFTFPDVNVKPLAQPTENDDNVAFSADKGVSVKRTGRCEISIYDGFLTCYHWVRPQGGKFGGTRQVPTITFPDAAITDRFIVICKRSGISVI